MHGSNAMFTGRVSTAPALFVVMPVVFDEIVTPVTLELFDVFAEAV